MAHKRYLVIVRAGDRSLHRRWLGFPRNFDIYLSFYGTGAEQQLGQVEYLRRMGKTKWPALAHHLVEDREIMDSYDAIWFPDDDILADTPTINRMFDLFMAEDLCLAQPALTHDSHHSHPLVLRHPDYVLRLTNFAEVMAPILDRRALRLLQPTFAQSTVGWGLDYLWPSLLEGAGLGNRIAILDETPVTHTRPVGGGDIYQVPGRRGEDDFARLALLYPGQSFDTREVTRAFAIRGGLRRVSYGRGVLARLVAMWHRRLARISSRHTKLFRWVDSSFEV